MVVWKAYRLRETTTNADRGSRKPQRAIERQFGVMEAGTFSEKRNSGIGGIRGLGAYRIAEFDISRRVGGGKTMDVPTPLPETETDRQLSRSRELLARLRNALPERG